MEHIRQVAHDLRVLLGSIDSAATPTHCRWTRVRRWIFQRRILYACFYGICLTILGPESTSLAVWRSSRPTWMLWVIDCCFRGSTAARHPRLVGVVFPRCPAQLRFHQRRSLIEGPW